MSEEWVDGAMMGVGGLLRNWLHLGDALVRRGNVQAIGERGRLAGRFVEKRVDRILALEDIRMHEGCSELAREI
eukprot:2403570-Pleurochrysis_carterae.AAC.1